MSPQDTPALRRLLLGRKLQSIARLLDDPEGLPRPSIFPDGHPLSDGELLSRHAAAGGSFGLWLSQYPEEIMPPQVAENDLPAALAIARFVDLRSELHDAAELAQSLPIDETTEAAETAIGIAFDLHGQMDVPALWHLMDGDPEDAVGLIEETAAKMSEACLNPFRTLGAKLVWQSSREMRSETPPREAENAAKAPLYSDEEYEAVREIVANDRGRIKHRRIQDRLRATRGKGMNDAKLCAIEARLVAEEVLKRETD